MRALPASLAGIGGAVLLTATLLVAPASAQPTTVAGLLSYYYDLSAQAELVNEELLTVQEQLTQQQQASAAAADAAGTAKAEADSLRAKADTAQDVDRVADALSSRSDLDALSALATSTSPDDLVGKLEAASLVAHLAGGPRQGDAALAAAEKAEQEATAAAKEAQDLEAKVTASANEVQQRRSTLDGQISEVRQALDNLTPEQRSLLDSIEDYDSGDVVIPGGNTGPVLQFALAQLGKPYLWGAVGPSSYDCSGLVQAAFHAAGVNMPRVSRQQATVGRKVARADVRAGDLIFYYEPVHHVAIAIDGTRAVHAPSFGQDVKVSSIDKIGPITVIRRVIP
ncbi:C40 family peptidase [Actinophytocola oryzae]|uniref:C40 family peptidase n=1 Tax=Actinophytocola oryzae TaxID=502181 RepID=UPI001063A647|nr:C40 family peptidase [Actinophytocola oryzae]